MTADVILPVLGVFFWALFVGLSIGARVHRWWLSKGRPASQRIDADVRFLRSVPAGVEREVQQ